MELVINANIIFSIASSSSVTRKIISASPITLFSPNFALEEIKKYKEEILKKTKIKNFEEYLEILENRINFIDFELTNNQIEEYKKIISDEKDIEYIALANKLNIPLWTNDKLLKNQNIIKVITTKELIELI